MANFWIARVFLEDLEPLIINEVFANTACDLERILQIQAGDVVLLYCAKTDRVNWTPVKSFYGISRILEDDVISYRLPECLVFGKKAAHCTAPPLPLRKVVRNLSFMRRRDYGEQFLDGLFQISQEDAAFIVHNLFPSRPIGPLIR